MATLPNQVEKAAKRADELHTKLYNKPAEEPEKLEEGATPPAKSETPEIPEETWESRYKSLKGKYDAEVPRLARELSQIKSGDSEAKATIKLLSDKIVTLEAILERQAEEKESTEGSTNLNIEAFSEYDTEIQQLATAVDKLTKENKQLKSVLESVDLKVSKVDTLEASIEKTKVDTATENFWSTLTTAVPNWESVNVDEEFLTWLATTQDEYSAETMQSKLDNAVKNMAAGTVANIFKKFIGLSPKYAQGDVPLVDKKEELARQAAPRTPKVDPVASDGSVKGIMWTKAKIAKFYKDAATGVLDDARVKQLEEDLFRAPYEGRVLNK